VDSVVPLIEQTGSANSTSMADVQEPVASPQQRLGEVHSDERECQVLEVSKEAEIHSKQEPVNAAVPLVEQVNNASGAPAADVQGPVASRQEGHCEARSVEQVVGASIADKIQALSAKQVISDNLDRFFSVGDSIKLMVLGSVDRNFSESVETSKFRVNVPKPYPGVQFRKSKNLNDKLPKYAKNGAVYAGQMESDGEWFRINSEVFLPTKIESVEILTPVPADEQQPQQQLTISWESLQCRPHISQEEHCSISGDAIDTVKQQPQCGHCALQ